jgi:hypothetical protein
MTLISPSESTAVDGLRPFAHHIAEIPWQEYSGDFGITAPVEDKEPAP